MDQNIALTATAHIWEGFDVYDFNISQHFWQNKHLKETEQL